MIILILLKTVTHTTTDLGSGVTAIKSEKQKVVITVVTLVVDETSEEVCTDLLNK